MRAERLLIGAVIALSVAVAAWASTGSTPTPGRPTTTSSTDVAVAVPLRTFASGDGAYSIDVPPGWRQLGEGPLMTFTDSTSAITIQTSTRVEPSTIDEITASVVADHVDDPGFAIGRTSPVALPRAGNAITTSYRASRPVPAIPGTPRDLTPIEVTRFVFTAYRIELTVTCVSPSPDFAGVCRRVVETLGVG